MILYVGLLIVLIDLICTLFGRPLIPPGPIAKFLYPSLENEDV